MGKLLAIDGLSIVRRIYQASQASSDEFDEAAKVESALRSAQMSFKKLLSVHQPSHVLVAFDAGGPAWRHDLYPRYRADREPMPPLLADALPGFYEALAETGLRVLLIPGVDADDVIATVTLRWLREQKGEAIIASTDKDLLVLIADGARVWDHFKGEWHDAAWVETKFGVPPSSMTDLIALMGDPGDGIPGVSKIGIKTAARLLQTYGSLEGVMAGAGILMDTMGERLRKEKDNAFLSRELARLKSDVQLGVTWNLLAVG
jgi:5'-3' exonuclease